MVLLFIASSHIDTVERNLREEGETRIKEQVLPKKKSESKCCQEQEKWFGFIGYDLYLQETVREGAEEAYVRRESMSENA